MPDRTSLDDKKDDWVLDTFGVDPRDYDRTPPPIDPAHLPPGPLKPTDYRAAASRNRYLAGKYDPKNLADRALNLATAAMDNPKRILTDAERTEHQALTAKIIETLNPPPTPQEARLDAMEASPLGAIASLATSTLGGNQAAQDAALNLGTAADGIGLAIAGARAGPATAFLGAQAGEAVLVVHEPGEEPPRAALPAPPTPELSPAPITADEQVKTLPGHGNARHGTATTTAQQVTRLLTGVAPDGAIKQWTTRATRFDSPEAQLDAVARGLLQTQARDAAGLLPHDIIVSAKGKAKLPSDRSIVSGPPGGYGSGVRLMPGVGDNSDRVISTGQYLNAVVVLEWDPMIGQWRTVTQFPTDLPVTQ